MESESLGRHPQNDRRSGEEHRDRGTSLIEYALLVALIAVPLFAASANPVDDVIRMYKSGVPEDAIIQFIQKADKRFDVTADDLRTLGRVGSAEQFGEIVIGTRGGTPVRVRDVAQVEDGAQELRTWSALFRKGSDGQEVVAIQVLRQSGANTVRVAEDVKSKLGELRAQLPPGVQLKVVHDISDFIKASVHSLLEHLILGSILASAIVWLFMRNWRAVLIAAVAIPASIIATFTLMRGMDFSLNNMTLLALTLAVGIVIDDAIIVLENIFRFMEDKGKDRKTAAIEATREIGLAVMATTLSLVIIFLPIAFMTGYARKYVNSFGWTMAMAILVSLLVAFTLSNKFICGCFAGPLPIAA